MTETKRKAIELVKSFRDFVNPYMGSGMLSNTYDNDAILFQAKKCAIAGLQFFSEYTKFALLQGWAYLAFEEEINSVTVEDIFDKN